MKADPTLRLARFGAVAWLVLGVVLGNWPLFDMGVGAALAVACVMRADRHRGRQAGPQVVHELADGAIVIKVDVGCRDPFGWGVVRLEVESAAPVKPDFLGPFLDSVAGVLNSGPCTLGDILGDLDDEGTAT
jgi:hypothetical protein